MKHGCVLLDFVMMSDNMINFYVLLYFLCQFQCKLCHSNGNVVS